jgi:hypothetical protein
MMESILNHGAEDISEVDIGSKSHQDEDGEDSGIDASD